MKTINFYLIFLLFFVSCNSSPKTTVKDFSNAVKTGDFEKAAKLTTYNDDEDYRKRVSEIQEGMVSSFNRLNGMVGFNISNEKISKSGDTAYIEVLYIFGEGSSYKNKIQLLKKSFNTWKINSYQMYYYYNY